MARIVDWQEVRRRQCRKVEKVIELKKNKDRLVLSRKAVVAIERAKQRETLLGELAEGQVRRGDYGVMMTMGPGSTIETALLRW